jgi:carbonic anhydrase
MTSTQPKKNDPQKSLCNVGTSQSPINIEASKTVLCTKKCRLKLFYRSSRCYMVNLGTEFVLNYDSGSYADFRGQIYSLEQISFTRPSSHRIDGRSYEIEMLLYHKNTITKNILVVSVFLEMNDAVSPSKSFLDQFIDYIPASTRTVKELDLGADWNIFQLIPFDKSFYNYSGSILKTPCTQNTEWIIYRTPVNASTHFFDVIKARFPNVNNREANNALGSRVVYFNPNTEPMFQINYGSTEKCYTEHQFRAQCSLVSKNSEVLEQNKKDVQMLVGLMAGVVIILILMWMYDTNKFTSAAAIGSAGLGKLTETVSGLKNKIVPITVTPPVAPPK